MTEYLLIQFGTEEIAQSHRNNWLAHLWIIIIAINSIHTRLSTMWNNTNKDKINKTAQYTYARAGIYSQQVSGAQFSYKFLSRHMSVCN